MIGILHKIKQRLGPLWWYAAILFCVHRLGEVINMIIGLYVVPKYVPQQELGAVLPLTKVGSMLVLPLAILIPPFKKFLNTYAMQGEYGKVKRLLLDMFVLSGVLAALALAYAGLFMPFVFERMRVTDGSLGLLIVLSGVIGALAPVLSSTLEALKRFNLIAVIGLFAAPLRLLTMLVCMPIRALSGYFVGQLVPDLFGMGISLWRLLHLLGSKVKSESYWKTDGKAMIRYTIPIAVYGLFGTLLMVVEAFVIRHRLPDMESAAYYMISRFAEVGNYLGNTVILVLFPLVAERHERGEQSARMLNQALGLILVGGGCLSICFCMFGRQLLSLVPAWSSYVAFAPQMALLSVVVFLRSAIGCFMTHEMASNRFGFVYYCCCVYLVEVVLLYAVTGFQFLQPYVPVVCMEWITAVNPGRLAFVLQVFCVFSIVTFVGMFWFQRRRGGIGPKSDLGLPRNA